LRPAWAFAVVLFALAVNARAHDIPNARVDRSTQVTIKPGRLVVDYEVSIGELTLTQELRRMIGGLPGADRAEWFQAYGRETGPLNAKGFLVTIGDAPVLLKMDGFDLAVEEHPRYTFHFSATIPASGTLALHDTNFVSSEGTSRLAVRGRGVTVRGDSLPGDVESIPAQPVWQLTDAEERRTRQVRVEYQQTGTVPGHEPPASRAASSPRPGWSLLALFDRALGLPTIVLCLLGFVLGTAHALQPGHGKTLVAASTLGERGAVGRGIGIAVVTTITHTGSVLLIAGLLWWTQSPLPAELHIVLTRVSGFVIAAVGVWRLGRRLSGLPEHEPHDIPNGSRTGSGVIGLGIAAGIVPCWDAVALIVIASALGRLGLGCLIVGCFSLGMGAVLVAIGCLAERLCRSVQPGRWERTLGLASGLALTAMGVYLLSS
jgi:nickel/cobalt transporter (NicO) family protein